MKNGQVRAGASGLYWIYAQINFLDPHQVNAFQVLINSSPFLLCTTMTETRVEGTSKTNTCFTGAATFLEQDDIVSLRHIEDNR